jgi:large subunit ribosomal protein L20
MPRSTTGTVHHKRSKKILKDAKGYYGARSKLYHHAKDARRRALQHSFKNRRRKKRDFRTLWILRIGAAVRGLGMSYSSFIGELKKTKIDVNRKMLADIAVNDMESFKKIVDSVKR